MIPDDADMDRPESADSLAEVFDEYLEAVDDLVASVSDEDIQQHLDMLMNNHCGQLAGFIPEQRDPISAIEDTPSSGMPAFEEVRRQWIPANTIVQLAFSEADEIRRRAHEEAEEIRRLARHRMHDAVGVQAEAQRSREKATEMLRKAKEDMASAAKLRADAQQFEHQALREAARIIGHAKEAADSELARATEAARQADCDRKAARRTRSEAEAYAQQLIQNGTDRVKNAGLEAERILRRARMKAAGLAKSTGPDSDRPAGTAPRPPEPTAAKPQPQPEPQAGTYHWLTDRFMNWFSQRRSRLWWGVLNCQDGHAAPLPRAITATPAPDDHTAAPIALLRTMLGSPHRDLFPDPADLGRDSMSVRMVRWNSDPEPGSPPALSEVKRRIWNMDRGNANPVSKDALRYAELVEALAGGSQDPCPPALLITATAKDKTAKILAVSAEFPELSGQPQVQEGSSVAR